ncbi:MAG TPA: hypothetical protein VNF50_03845 [Acidimicrobiales bacterium]|nr:hypothetical protein [Acidimicrobiales bacterium]
MRFKTGLVLGAGVGYYLGAAAGRPRYEQLRRLLDRAGGSEAVSTAGGKARAVIDLTLERARDAIDARVTRTDSGAGAPHPDPRHRPNPRHRAPLHRVTESGKAPTLNGAGA